MRWPFSLRWGCRCGTGLFWMPRRSPLTQNRIPWEPGRVSGAGLGHCGACHTPRGIGFQEKAMTELGGKGKYFLAGETVESPAGTQLARAVDGRRYRPVSENRAKPLCHGPGSMAEVIHHSTQHVRDDDLRAIATILKALPPGENELPAPNQATRRPRRRTHPIRCIPAVAAWPTPSSAGIATGRTVAASTGSSRRWPATRQSAPKTRPPCRTSS